MLCDVKVSRDASKKRRTEEGLYGKLSEGAQSLELTAADAVVALGSLNDATFGARTAHRWPFQPQREGDARKAAREARSSRRSELVACAPGAGDGSRGHVVCLGRGCRPACLGHFKRKLSSLIGGLKWKGPFMSKELTSRETATRDVIVTESGKDISWCLFDGQTFEEVKLECHGALLGVVAADEPLDASSTVYLIYEGGTWQSARGVPYAIDATRLHLTMKWVVSVSISSACRARSRLDTYHTQVPPGRQGSERWEIHQGH